MNTSSSPKRSRTSSPSALPNAFPLCEQLKEQKDVFRHIFFDVMDAETRHICRAVSASWMAALPALEGPDVTGQLNGWACKNGYAHFLALGPFMPVSYFYTAVEGGHVDIATLLLAVKCKASEWDTMATLVDDHERLKEIAAKNADLPMLEFLHQFEPHIPDSVLDYILETRPSEAIVEWVKCKFERQTAIVTDIFAMRCCPNVR